MSRWRGVVASAVVLVVVATYLWHDMRGTAPEPRVGSSRGPRDAGDLTAPADSAPLPGRVELASDDDEDAEVGELRLIGVVQLASGIGVEGVSMILERRVETGEVVVVARTRTARQGAFSFQQARSGVATGASFFAYTADERFIAERRAMVVIGAGSSFDFGTIVVAPALNTTRIVVRDALGSPLVAKVFVQAERGASRSETGPAGDTTVPLHAEERIEYVRVSAPNHALSLTRGPAERNPAVVTCVCTEPGDAVVLRLATDTGPLRGATLSLRGVYGLRDEYLEARLTDDEGCCALEGVPRNRRSYGISVLDRDGRVGTGTWENEVFWRTLTAGQPLRIDVAHERSLSVRVVAPSGSPVAGAEVRVFSSDGTYQARRSGVDGRVAIDAVSQRGRVNVFATGFAEESIRFGPELSEVVVSLVPGRSYEGVVTCDGAGVAEVLVYFAPERLTAHRAPGEGLAGQALTGSGGAFRLDHVGHSGFLVFRGVFGGVLDRQVAVDSWTGAVELTRSAIVGVRLPGRDGVRDGTTIGRHECTWLTLSERRDESELSRGRPCNGTITYSTSGGAAFGVLEGVQARIGDVLEARMEIVGGAERAVRLTATGSRDGITTRWE